VSIQTFDQVYYLTEGSGNTDQQQKVSLQCTQHEKLPEKNIRLRHPYPSMMITKYSTNTVEHAYAYCLDLVGRNPSQNNELK
jgi:hypothetical protein